MMPILKYQSRPVFLSSRLPSFPSCRLPSFPSRPHQHPSGLLSFWASGFWSGLMYFRFYRGLGLASPDWSWVGLCSFVPLAFPDPRCNRARRLPSRLVRLVFSYPVPFRFVSFRLLFYSFSLVVLPGLPRRTVIFSLSDISYLLMRALRYLAQSVGWIIPTRSGMWSRVSCLGSRASSRISPFLWVSDLVSQSNWFDLVWSSGLHGLLV